VRSFSNERKTAEKNVTGLLGYRIASSLKGRVLLQIMHCLLGKHDDRLITTDINRCVCIHMYFDVCI